MIHNVILALKTFSVSRSQTKLRDYINSKSQQFLFRDTNFENYKWEK